MKIVVLDGYTLNPGDLNWDGFKKLGDFTCYDRTLAEMTVGRIGSADAVITNKTVITRKILDECPNIKYIGLLSTGYNAVDINAAREKGIPVTNIPTYGTASVAQFAIALLLELCHHVAHHSEAVYSGRWEHSVDFCFWDYPQTELDGKTMGIIGFGRIGRAVGKLAQAFGMNVLAYDKNRDPAFESETCRYADFDRVIKESHVISLHCPLMPETRGIINGDAISRMRDGVMIINNSRGPLIVEKDLAAALNSGKVAGAAVDVVSEEPIRGDNPLLKAKNCIITPHIAWAPVESRQRLMNTASDNLKQFLNGTPVNVVNK